MAQRTVRQCQPSISRSNHIDQLFDSLDPSPFYEKALAATLKSLKPGKDFRRWPLKAG
jgi:hypothetical protein